MDTNNEKPAPRQTTVTTGTGTDIGQRISVGLIALSLSLISLALGAAFFSVTGPAAFLVAPLFTVQSVPSSATAVTLTWTAPGDDGNTGQATAYDLRYSTSSITALNFGTATTVAGEPAPQPAGSTEEMTVTNLIPATTYYFALTTSDDAANVSGVSNVATATTDALPVVCTPIYVCFGWSACINSVQTRTCSITNGCSSNLDAPITSQACTMPVVAPTPTPSPEPTPTPTPSTPPAVGGEPAHVIKHIVAAGVGPGMAPVVRIINPVTTKAEKEFLVFRRENLNGTNVEVGDVDGNHSADVLVGSGVGSDPLVKLYSNQGVLMAQLNPYPTSRGIGVDVAAGDVDGDGIDEILTIPAKGVSQLRIFKYDVATKKFLSQAQTFVYPRTATQGFTVAAGDLDLDGRADIIVAPRADGGSVTVLKFTTQKTILNVRSFFPFAKAFKTGITIDIGDTDGNGRGEIVTTPGYGVPSNVKVFDISARQLRSFLPATTAWLGGVDLTVLDVNADGRDEVITGSYRNGDPSLRIFRYSGITQKFSLIQNYFVYPRTMKSGLRLGSR